MRKLRFKEMRSWPEITEPVNGTAMEWKPDVPGYPAYVIFFTLLLT